MSSAARIILAIAAATMVAAFAAPAANAGLEEGPFHATQIHGEWQGALNLACEASLEGEIQDGGWNSDASGEITNVTYYDCDPPCAINVITPLPVSVDPSGSFTMYDYDFSWHCPGMGEIPFTGPEIVGQWDCEDEGTLAFVNQVFYVGGMPAMVWNAEWHVEGLHLDGSKDCV